MARGQPPLRFIEQELRAYLRCGILAHGFLRLRCDDCGHDRLVAFSCTAFVSLIENDLHGLLGRGKKEPGSVVGRYA